MYVMTSALSTVRIWPVAVPLGFMLFACDSEKTPDPAGKPEKGKVEAKAEKTKDLENKVDEAAGAEERAAVTTSSACRFPNGLPANPTTEDYQQVMWRIFVAANCKAQAPNNQYGSLVWENWPEQDCLVGDQSGKCTQQAAIAKAALADPAAPKPRRVLHHGAAAKAVAGGNAFGQDCIGHDYCEEVVVSPAELEYLQANKLLGMKGQLEYAKKSTTTPPISMPPGSVEIKVGWAKMGAGACAPSTTLHVETFADDKGVQTCYALVGMHVSSKLLPNWIWSTFEPQDTKTNPQRCLPPGAKPPPGSDPSFGQYGPCNDAWGSDPPRSDNPNPTSATPALRALFASAGDSLPAAFHNYRLDGVQTEFMNGDAPTLLGNSRIEADARVPSGKASCITCHSNPMVFDKGGTATEVPFTGAMLSGVGPAAPVPPGYYQLDFSWMLGFTTLP
ncbi:hypothetical protein [Nannocystis sp. SCPEA4]|uniref:hypothetical protein n=1 Tax=Nannocystis sp. SCPEA4 TaxID=2996787 RepID=UPI00226DC636|nr:hypothetical protein [Nannocystis sp. SCPEA4]